MKLIAHINVPFCKQKSDSASCGPCCLKMVLDYYHRRRNRKKYSKMSLVKLANTSAEYGTSFVNMKRVLREAGLKYKKLMHEIDLVRAIASSHPVIALVKDPGPYFSGRPIEEYHYIVLTGLKMTEGLFSEISIYYDDPYYGAGKEMRLSTLLHLMKPHRWMIEVFE